MRRFKHFKCPVCGRQLINLNTERTQEKGFHAFWCDVCDIDISIDENQNSLYNINDD